MLELKNIKKVYEIGKPNDKNYQMVEALNGVNVQFRDTEFVSILGQSGCGKTTLLNIIGGLDQYTDGDLIINGISTKQYKDSDWDNYRNHKIGFIFQSYNLIPHQTVLENVELALTLSGVNKEERRKRAIEALNKVGLNDKINNKPSQLSGGQMQRVAIARAIINNPDIILADEPTGALDTKTSVQVMDILKEISKEKLVIMVTHNPELAEHYSTRIIKLLDGRIVDDSFPFFANDVPNSNEEIKDSKKEKTSMSFLTALSLSGKNLLTKKGRTALISIAGSIGIIGISLILSLSNGFKMYIDKVQEDTLSTYPLTLNTAEVDYSSVIASIMSSDDTYEVEEDGSVHPNEVMINMFNSVISGSSNNDLTSFRKYILDNPELFEDYIVKYGYTVDLNVYDGEDHTLLNPMTVFTDLMAEIANAYNTNYPDATVDFTPLIKQVGSLNSSVFSEMLDSMDLIKRQYDLVGTNYGSRWPSNYDECILVVNSDYTLNDYELYALGLTGEGDPQLKDIANGLVDSFTTGEEYDINLSPVSFEKILNGNTKYRVLVNTDYYEENEDGTYTCQKENKEYVNKIFANNIGFDLKVVGIVKEKENVTAHSITSPIGYMPSLTKELIRRINESDIMIKQKANPKIDVLTGLPFEEDNKTSEEKRETIISYIQNLDAEGVNNLRALLKQSSINIPDDATDEEVKNTAIMMMNGLSDSQIDMVYSTMFSTNSYNQNLIDFGQVSEDKPNTISFYCSTFESKKVLKKIIDDYNNQVKNDPNKGEAYVISYTDYVAIMMSSISTIIDSISYVLIAFVSVSLVVSSIMIGIITYISVLERTKEIGILRSIGASKKDIKHVFTAESLIIGFCSGLFGIIFTVILDLPISLIIESLTGIANVAVLPFVVAIILVLLSCLLTFIAGLIPSSFASKRDPVIALRSE